MKKSLHLIILLSPFALFAQDEALNHGKALLEKEDYAGAEVFFKEFVTKDQTNDQAYYYLARSAYFSENYDDAEKNLKKAIELNNDNADYFLLLGNVYLQRLQNSSFFEKGILSGKVLDNYKKAVKTDPENIEARLSLASYYINAPSIGGGSASKAREQIEIIRKDHPEQALMLMAQVYIQEENYDLAIEEFHKYLHGHPDDTHALYQLGMLYQGMKNYEDATLTFERALEKDPGDHASLYQVGRTAIFWGDNIDRGIEALTTYINSDPGPGNPSLDAAHWRLGMLYEMRGNLETARHEYALALEMVPDEEKYKKALDALK